MDTVRLLMREFCQSPDGTFSVLQMGRHKFYVREPSLVDIHENVIPLKEGIYHVIRDNKCFDTEEWHITNTLEYGGALFAPNVMAHHFPASLIIGQKLVNGTVASSLTERALTRELLDTYLEGVNEFQLDIVRHVSSVVNLENNPFYP